MCHAFAHEPQRKAPRSLAEAAAGKRARRDRADRSGADQGSEQPRVTLEGRAPLWMREHHSVPLAQQVEDDGVDAGGQWQEGRLD
jgi:hypothetical protein